MRVRSSVVLLSLAAVVIGACTRPALPTSPTSVQTPRVSSGHLIGAPRPKTYDEEMAAIDSEAPGFAGAFLTPEGEFVLLVAEGRDSARVLGAFRARLSPINRSHATLVRRVRWSFNELATARAMMEQVAEGELVWSDIDEASNRVAAAVGAPALAGALTAALVGRGMDPAMIHVVVDRAPKLTSTLEDGLRPVIGAMAIDMEQFAAACTGSFAVQYYGYSTDYFSTNSHCTTTRFGLDTALTIRQPTWWASDYPTLGRIGNEVVDPNLFWGMTMCTTNSYCRYSDASLFAATSASVTGRIAQTTYSASTPGSSGSTTLAASNFNVAGALTNNDIYVGLAVNKIGRVTGWTTGQVEATCVRLYYAYPEVPQTFHFECQMQAGTTTKKGDSGSPVFVVNEDGTVTIAGQGWGGSNLYYLDPNGNENNNIYASVVFSSWPDLQTDLGNILPKAP